MKLGDLVEWKSKGDIHHLGVVLSISESKKGNIVEIYLINNKKKATLWESDLQVISES